MGGGSQKHPALLESAAHSLVGYKLSWTSIAPKTKSLLYEVPGILVYNVLLLHIYLVVALSVYAYDSKNPN